MQALAPKHSISANPARGEVTFSITGFWELEPMREFVGQLDKYSWPIVKAKKNIFVMGDMDGFVTQSREVGDVIRDHLHKAQEFKLARVAICNASPLVKLQYQRLSSGIEVDFFTSHADAMRWLRRPYAAAA